MWASMGVGDVLKLRVFLCAAETTVGKVLSTSISTSESSDIFSTIWGIILDAERRKKSFI